MLPRKVKPIKINIKEPTPTAAERLHARQQEIRKAAGLPDPEHYKKLAAQKQKEIDAMKNEEVEQLDEMPESSMKTKDVHAHLKKSGWSLARTTGGHDIYKHPKASGHISVPRHKQLKAPLIKGILKASKVNEEAVEEQLEKPGRFVSGAPKKPFKAPTIVSAIKEDIKSLQEKNVPTSPEKWARAKAQAKAKFDVYPSAYANGWAAKKYKEMGGGWKSVNEETEKPLSRKAQIVKDIVKGKKAKQDAQDEASDKFQKDPELSSDIQKT